MVGALGFENPITLSVLTHDSNTAKEIAFKSTFSDANGHKHLMNPLVSRWLYLFILLSQGKEVLVHTSTGYLESDPDGSMKAICNSSNASGYSDILEEVVASPFEKKNIVLNPVIYTTSGPHCIVLHNAKDLKRVVIKANAILAYIATIVCSDTELDNCLFTLDKDIDKADYAPFMIRFKQVLKKNKNDVAEFDSKLTYLHFDQKCTDDQDPYKYINYCSGNYRKFYDCINDEELYSPDTISIKYPRHLEQDHSLPFEDVGPMKLFDCKKGNGYDLKKIIDNNFFKMIDPGKLSDAEKARIPTVEEGHICDPRVIELAKDIYYSTDSKMPLRNFLLSGPGGTGKTVMCRDLAAVLGLPYGVVRGRTDMDGLDLLYKVLPNIDCFNSEEEDTKIKKELQKLPTVKDIKADPQNAYERMLGKKIKGEITEEEVLTVYLSKQASLIHAILRNEKQKKSDFKATPTDLLKALRSENGFVCEIQEPDLIRQPGVLASLNECLDVTSGIVSLETGETFIRQKNCIIILTCNQTYEGCNSFNQSVIRRIQKLLEINLPSTETIVNRIINQTDATNVPFVRTVVCELNKINEYLNENEITDGSCGVSEAINFVQACCMNQRFNKIEHRQTLDIRKTAVSTIVNSATFDTDEREFIYTTFLQPLEKSIGEMLPIS